MSSLVILVVIWIVMGGLVGYYAPSIFKGDRPYGVNGDLIVGIVTSVAVGLMDWYIVPMIFPSMGQAVLFLAAILEPLLVVLLVLWLIRYIKNR